MDNQQIEKLQKIILEKSSSTPDTNNPDPDQLRQRLWALKQLIDLLMVPQQQQSYQLKQLRPILINDLEFFPQLLEKLSEEEKILRCKLASTYRLIELHGWSMSIYNHITVRVSDLDEHFLINPFGLLYDEITAASLIKVDLNGNVLEQGSTKFTINKAGFVLHSAIHHARPDLKAVIHIHHPACVAVSASKKGLLLTSQEASIVGHVSYHDYHGLLIDENERKDIVKNLGPKNSVMILKNHGVMVAGGSLEEAFAMLSNVILACEAQVKMETDNIEILEDSVRDQVQMALRQEGASLQGLSKDPKKRMPMIYDLEFEARMRQLDDAGLQTGYPYRIQKPTLAASLQNKNDPKNNEQLLEFFQKLLMIQN